MVIIIGLFHDYWIRHCIRHSIFAITPILLVMSIANTSANVRISGEYKSLLAFSKTLSLFPPPSSYTADLNRITIYLDGELSDRVSFNIQYENELTVGDYLKTNQFSAQKSITPDTYIKLDHAYADTSEIYARHRIYRAQLKISFEEADLRIGRQRIAWGSALFWSPVDSLNPINPTALERDRRTGVDAIVLDWDYADLSRMSVIYAVHAAPTRASTAVRWRSHNGGFDWALSAGRFRNDDIAGLDIAGQIGKIGVRGEMTHTQSPVDGSYGRLVVGADYIFQNTLSVNAELYFNGQGKTNTGAYDFTRLLNGEIQSLAQRYLGLHLAYDIAPLLKWKNYYIKNLDDQSHYYSPELVYSISENNEAVLGAQLFAGNPGSEYASFENVYFLQWQWFF